MVSKVKEYVLTIKNYNEEYDYYKSLLEKISEKNVHYMYQIKKLKIILNNQKTNIKIVKI